MREKKIPCGAKARVGQVNLEFLAAAIIYLVALGSLMTVGSDTLPQVSESVEKASLNLEARQVTTLMLTTTGNHSFGTGGSDWERNDETIRHATSFGLAEPSRQGPRFMNVSREKLEQIRSFNPVSGPGEYFNYSQFRRITHVDNQYRFRFTWLPIVETPRSFLRCNPPAAPAIVEPVPCNPADGLSDYERADNVVHYGSAELDGNPYRFLVVSHDGSYDTLYVSSNWDFSGTTGREEGETFDIHGSDFNVSAFQNKEKTPGSAVIIERNLKVFGPSPETDSTVVRLDRYAILEGEPMRVEVLTW